MLAEETLKMLGCTSSADELQAALLAARNHRTDFTQHRIDQQLAERTAAERFRDLKTKTTLTTIDTDFKPKAVRSPQHIADAGALELAIANAKREHAASVLLGRKRSQFSV